MSEKRPRAWDIALMVRLLIGGGFIYAAAFERSPWALAIVLSLTMLSCEAIAYSVHGPRKSTP